jgi:transcriptional regulator with XRE-family HTH domain
MNKKQIISEKIKTLRKERKISQKELGEICGVGGAAIRKIELQINFPSVPLLLNIADFFDVSADFLLGRSDDRRGGI